MNDDPILDRVLAILNQRNAEPVTAINVSQPLDELGVDSLDLVQILSDFEFTEDVAFADSDFDLKQYRTLADLATMISTRVDG